MDTIIINAQKRDVKIKPNIFRQKGEIPAVFYGAQKTNTPISINHKNFIKVFSKVGGNTILDLVIEGKKIPEKVLIHAVALDPVTDKVKHVDFLNIDMDKKITTSVPLKFEGIAPAIKNFGGIFTVNRHEILIRCLPINLPRLIEIDISNLKEIHASIHARDIKMPADVEILDDPEISVCSITILKKKDEEEVVNAETVPDSAKEPIKADGSKGDKDSKDNREEKKEKKSDDKK